MSEAPPTETPPETTSKQKMESDISAAASADSPLHAMRELAHNQAVRAIDLVKEAETHAKANGEDTDVVLERMIMARLEEKASAQVQARVAATAYEDCYERIILVGNGIHKAEGIKKHQIVERLSILADGIKTTQATMLKKASQA